MTAPVSTYVQLPSDSANTGKKNRTQTKTVGANSVHEHYVVLSPDVTKTGRYIASTTAPVAVSTAAAAASTAGIRYLHMSTSATVTGQLRYAEIGWGQASTVNVASPSLLFSLQKYTFNTAHSGTTVNIVATQTSSTTPQANVRSAPTGATITLVGQIGHCQIPAMVTTVGQYGGSQVLYEVREQGNRMDAVEFGPGEGICLFPVTSGVAADVRNVTCKFVWDEIDLT